MKYLITLILFVLLFSGCDMKKYCHDRFPPVIQTETEIKEVIIYRDTTIYIPIPGDTLIIRDTIVVTEGIAYMPLKRLSTEICLAESWIENNIHNMELIQKDTVLERLIEDAIKESVTTVTETIPVEIPVHFKTWWDELWIRLGKVFLGALAVLLIIAGFRRQFGI